MRKMNGFGLVDGIIGAAIMSLVAVVVLKTMGNVNEFRRADNIIGKQLDVEGSLRGQIRESIRATMDATDPGTCNFWNRGTPTRCDHAQSPVDCDDMPFGEPEPWEPDLFVFNKYLSGFNHDHDPNNPGFRKTKAASPIDALRIINLSNRFNKSEKFGIRKGPGQLASRMLSLCAVEAIATLGGSGQSIGKCVLYIDRNFSQADAERKAVIAHVMPHRYDFTTDEKLDCQQYLDRNAANNSVGVRAMYTLVLVNSTPPFIIETIEDLYKLHSQAQIQEWMVEYDMTLQEIFDEFKGKKYSKYFYEAKSGWVDTRLKE